MPAATHVIESFIARWSAASGSERANYQLFITELSDLLGLPKPEPAQADAGENAYCFARNVVFRHGDGTQSHGFIDGYRRGAFVLEAKKLRVGGAWKKRLPEILETLTALGRARSVEDSRWMG